MDTGVAKAYMPTNVREGEVEKEEDGVHRLHSILVEEVSPVDQAANQRRFLIAKRTQRKSMPTPLRSDGNGALTAGRTPAQKAPDDMGGGDAGGAPPPEEAAPPDAGAGEGAMTLPSGAKAELSQVLEAVGQKIGELADMVNGATEADGAQVPPAMLSDLGSIGDLLDAVQAKYGAGGESGSPEAPAEGAPEGATPMTARHPAAKSAISRARFAAIQKLWTLIDALLAEMEPVVATPRARAAAVSTGAPAPAAESEAAVAKAMQVIDLQEKEIAKLRGMPQPRQSAGTPEAPKAPPAPKEESKSWGYDFNRPLNRETVPADESFFDADT